MAHEGPGRRVGLLPEARDGAPLLLAWFISAHILVAITQRKNSKIFRTGKILKDFSLSKNPYILVEPCKVVFIMTQITLFSPPQLSLLSLFLIAP